MDRDAGDITPRVTQAYAEAAARRQHFNLVSSVPLPDGRHARVWFRPR